MVTLTVVGIGAGDPEHLTVQAIAALNAADVLFTAGKPGARDELVALRRQICARYVTGPLQLVEIPDPERDRDAADYQAAVEDWRARRADAWSAAIVSELGDDGHGAFLVWGDPAFYDSTIAILDDLRARGAAFEVHVVPGISSVQALAAAHRIALNRVGGAVHVTPGRLLRDGWPGEAGDVVVMLDAESSFRAVASAEVEIFWGAYLSTPDELLISGPLTEPVMAEIERVRAEARERKGWIMDTYLLRRTRAA